MLNLLLAPRHESLQILRVKENRIGNQIENRHLKNLGFVEGAKIEIINEVSGNLIVKVKDSKVAIDHRVARSIYVS